MCTISIIFVRWRQCTRRHSAVSCAKTAEPIDLPFGLWTLVAEESTSSIVFTRWRHCALPCWYTGATWRLRLNRPSAAATRSYVKLLWLLVVVLLLCSVVRKCEHNSLCYTKKIVNMKQTSRIVCRFLDIAADSNCIWHKKVQVQTLKHLLIACFICNTSAKKYQNLFMCVKVIASHRWDVFWDTVYTVSQKKTSHYNLAHNFAKCWPIF